MPRRFRASLFLACAGLALAWSPRVAPAAPPGFAFLEIPSGARVSALAGAGESFAEGVDAAFWNPAALDQVKGIQVEGSHYELYQNLRHDDFAVAGRLFGGGISASLRALYSGPIDETDELGNVVGTFGSHDLDFALGYGAALGGGVQAGVTGHVIRERISNLGATTYGFDFGTRWKPVSMPHLLLSVGAYNLGPSARYTIDGIEGEPVSLPAAMGAGGSYHFGFGGGLDLRTGLEGRFTRGRAGVGMIAAELTGLAGASLRAGYRGNDDTAGFSAGLGYAFPALRLDYAYVPSALDLGDTHRFSFSAQF